MGNIVAILIAIVAVVVLVAVVKVAVKFALLAGLVVVGYLVYREAKKRIGR